MDLHGAPATNVPKFTGANLEEANGFCSFAEKRTPARTRERSARCGVDATFLNLRSYISAFRTSSC